jgi:prevent-host-death family protein
MPGDSWQLQRAKAEFSKLIETSITKGPQTVTRHGRPAAVVLSVAEYRRLTRRGRDFKRFLRQAPIHALDLTRSADRGRPVRL